LQRGGLRGGHFWDTALTVFTIGHSTRASADFLALLAEAEVSLLVDVRSYPQSRTNPQFNSDALAQSLAAAGIRYLHLRALGGRRAAGPGASPNTLWRNAAFRNYADYAAGGAFRAALEELKTLAASERCAIMCSEAVWWRCHRRIIADYLLADEVAVAHIMGPGRIEPASLTPGAERSPDGHLVYAATENGLQQLPLV
jgi:uncharacterized protein (DUF488 family)